MGPVFIVGRPRSGTTLFRNLLGAHPAVAFPAYESHFVPGMIQQFGTAPPFWRQGDELQTGLARFKNGQLYKKGLERREYRPDDTAIRAALTAGNQWHDVIRALFALYSRKDMFAAHVWGDKTPRYLQHIDLLFQALPDAVFLHIIRDPRDQALSERAIWGKSIRRAAASWQTSIRMARESAAAEAGRYQEVLFETLVTEPEAELSRVCGVLGLEFDVRMLSGAPGSDELGQMVGVRKIDAGSVGGRRASMSCADERTIAAFAGPVASDLAYELPECRHRNMGRAERRVLQAYDRAAVARYHLRQRDGIRKGVATLRNWQRERLT